jgi:AraC-like DNA-binding protein
LLPLVPDLEERSGQVLPAHNPAVGLLNAYILSAIEQRALAQPGVEATLARHAADLIALALGADATRQQDSARSVRAARLLVLQAYVSAHLHEADLAVASVAARHGITARYVQKLFAGTGESFSEYVLRQRLACAYRRLTDPRLEHSSIIAIAFDAGFSDLSHFNRSFRRRFGHTPSEARRSARVRA